MPIVNLFDRRTNGYNVNVDAVIEPSWHDNSIEGATQFTPQEGAYTCYDMGTTTLEEAIRAWQDTGIPYTLYIYDVGANNVHPL